MMQLEKDITTNGTVVDLTSLEASHFGEKKSNSFPSPEQIKGYIKVRSLRTLTKDNKPKYATVTGKKRADLIEEAISKKTNDVLLPYLEEPANR
jgi:hypothetical protein